MELVNLLSWKVAIWGTLSSKNILRAFDKALQCSHRYLLFPSSLSTAKKLLIPYSRVFERWHSLSFIYISYNVEVVISFSGHGLKLAVQAINTGLNDSSEDIENVCIFDLPLIGIPVFSKLSSLAILHTFN